MGRVCSVQKFRVPGSDQEHSISGYKFQEPQGKRNTENHKNYYKQLHDHKLDNLEETVEKAMAPHSSTLAWKIPWVEAW